MTQQSVTNQVIERAFFIHTSKWSVRGFAWCVHHTVPPRPSRSSYCTVPYRTLAGMSSDSVLCSWNKKRQNQSIFGSSRMFRGAWPITWRTLLGVIPYNVANLSRCTLYCRLPLPFYVLLFLKLQRFMFCRHTTKVKLTGIANDHKKCYPIYAEKSSWRRVLFWLILNYYLNRSFPKGRPLYAVMPQ